MDHCQHSFPFVADQRQSWRTDMFGTNTTGCLSKLDILHQLGMQVQLQQRQEPAMDLPRLFYPACFYQLVNSYCLGRESANKTAYPPYRSHQQFFHCDGINSAKDTKPVPKRVDQSRDIGYVPCGLLYRLDIRQLYQ